MSGGPPDPGARDIVIAMDDDVTESTSREPENDPLLEDLELVRGAPIRRTEWLAGPLIIGLAGIAGVAVLIWLAPWAQLHLAAWMLGGIAVLLVPYAALLAYAGHRSYVFLTPETVRRLIGVRLIGYWGFTVVVLVSGIMSGVWFLTLLAFTMSQSIYLAYGLRNTGQQSELSRLARRLQPALIAECIFAIAAPPIAAVISLNFNLPEKLGAQYFADAIVVPIYAAIVLVAILRRRRMIIS